MKTKEALKTILILLTALIFIAGATLTSCFNVIQPKESIQEEENQPGSTSSQETETSEQPVNQAEKAEEMIKLISPKPGDTVSSPLLIKGEARGTWYFEASFPVKLLDADGNIIAVHYAQAQGEWMTEEFVPFTSELIFETPQTETGTLVLQKDNPSGLAENDASIEIPVKFARDSKIIEDTDPSSGEYFAGAILKKIDLANSKIIVEQLINEPNEKIIPPEVTLATDCKIVKIILERPEEKEITTEITLNDIAIGSEIGIIFRADNTARAIIYQEIVEK